MIRWIINGQLYRNIINGRGREEKEGFFLLETIFVLGENILQKQVRFRRARFDDIRVVHRQ